MIYWYMINLILIMFILFLVNMIHIYMFKNQKQVFASTLSVETPCNDERYITALI